MKLEQQIKEFIKCKESFEYFTRNYIMLELPGKTELMRPYNKQLELIDFIEKHKHVVILKSRQIGISTIIQAYACWLCTFFKNVHIGIISKDSPEATTFSRKIITLLEYLPKWLAPRFVKRTEQTFILANGCQCTATCINKVPSKTLRGKDTTLLIVDEAAFCQNLDEAWTALVPSLSTSQKHARENNIPYGTIILSTPNKTVGCGAWFYNKYLSALSGDGIFKYFEIHWRDIPELDDEWYKIQCELLDNNQTKIDQELELKFVSDQSSFLPDQICRILQDNTKKYSPIEIIHSPYGEIWIFERPKADKFYLIGVDVATAYGEDNSAIVVFDYESLEQVCEFQSKCKISDFCKVVMDIASIYRDGLLIIENNSIGNQVVEFIEESEFSFMLYKEQVGSNLRTGINVNTKTRRLIMDSLYTYITQYPNSVKSKRLALELIGLTEKRNRIEASIGCHDDLALAAAFCFYVHHHNPPRHLAPKNEWWDDDLKLALHLNDINSEEDDTCFHYL